MQNSRANYGMTFLAFIGVAMLILGAQSLFFNPKNSITRVSTLFASNSSRSGGGTANSQGGQKPSRREKRKLPLSGGARYFLGIEGDFMQIKHNAMVFDSEFSAKRGFPQTIYLRGKTVEILGEIGKWRIIYKPEYPNGTAFIDSSALCKPVN